MSKTKNVLSKQYQGIYHLAVVVVAAVLTVLTSDAALALDFEWVRDAATFVAGVGLFLQRLTPLFDQPSSE